MKKEHYISKIKDKVFYVDRYNLIITPAIITKITSDWRKIPNLELSLGTNLTMMGVTEDYYYDYAEAFLRLKHFINLKKTEMSKEFYEKMLQLDKKLEI